MDEPTVDQVLASGDAERPAFRPAVAPAKSRARAGFVVMLLCTLTAGGVVFVMRAREGVQPTATVTWWSNAGVQCTPLGVHVAIRNPEWNDIQRATCLAIAGNVDAARARLLDMSVRDRSEALQLIFSIAHPIADAGDDRSAGPIMTLVSEQWPENYMAVFHAGMAEFALGHDDVARVQLERFLTMYEREDIWRGRARKALTDIAANTPLARREAHFQE